MFLSPLISFCSRVLRPDRALSLLAVDAEMGAVRGGAGAVARTEVVAILVERNSWTSRGRDMNVRRRRWLQGLGSRAEAEAEQRQRQLLSSAPLCEHHLRATAMSASTSPSDLIGSAARCCVSTHVNCHHATISSAGR